MVTLQRMERQILRNFPLGADLVEVNEAMAGTDDGDRLLPLPDRLPNNGANLMIVPSISVSAVRQIRSNIGDNRGDNYFTNQELQQFYLTENRDIIQASALALEVWASQISYDEGGVSAGGVTVNGPAMAADKRQKASEFRLQLVKSGIYPW